MLPFVVAVVTVPVVVVRLRLVAADDFARCLPKRCVSSISQTSRAVRRMTVNEESNARALTRSEDIIWANE